MNKLLLCTLRSKDLEDSSGSFAVFAHVNMRRTLQCANTVMRMHHIQIYFFLVLQFHAVTFMPSGI